MQPYRNSIISWKQVSAFLMLSVWFSCRSACVIAPILEDGCCPAQNDHSHAVDKSARVTNLTNYQVCNSSDHGDHDENEHSKIPVSLPCCENAIAAQQQLTKFIGPFEDRSKFDYMTDESERVSAFRQIKLHRVDFNVHDLTSDLKRLHWILVSCGHFSQAPPALL